MRIILFIILLSSIKVSAQHCGYDHTALLGVRVVDANNELVKGLHILMIDEKGNPLLVNKHVYKNNKYISSYLDTAEFWQNPSPTKKEHFRIREENKRHFIQAGEDYILLTKNLGRAEKGRYIRIEDIDGADNGGKFNTKIVYVKSEHIQGLCGYPKGKQFMETYRPLVVMLTPITEATYQQFEKTFVSNEIVYFVHPFKFVLERNYKLVALPAGKGYYANQISIYEANSTEQIFSIVAVGDKLKQLSGCVDSLQIADFNFDGYPDFRLCNNSAAGKYTYYIYHKKRNTFIVEKTLTELNDLTFDFEHKMAKGNTDRKEFMGYPWDSPYQYYMETLQFEGKALEDLTVSTTTFGSETAVTAKAKYINQKRIYAGDSLVVKIQKNNLLIKTVGGFRFEVEFNPEEYKPSGEKGSYVKILNVYDKERRIGHYEMHGNYLKEVPHWLDSLEIVDYNFDGFTDIRMYNSHLNNGRYVYFLYNPQPDTRQFYEDTYFSLLRESEFIPNQKIIKGKILEPNQTIFFFLKNDTLTLTKQDNDLSKPPFIEECIYKNGNKKNAENCLWKVRART